MIKKVQDEKVQKHINEYRKYLTKAKETFFRNWTQKLKETGKLEEFELSKTLGSGAFGVVILVKHKETGNIIAMKLLEKKKIISTSQITHVKSEIKIMKSIQFEFLLTLKYFFKDNVYLFIGMPFINGGEMFTHLRTMKRFEEANAKFYSAQVILAFEYLHYLGIIYRDLKPENILIDSDGYIKITDYGFCKKIDENRTYTLCGTPDYLAPEIILSQGYTFSIDYWTLGILIFEMVAGTAPFYGSTPIKLYEKIVSGIYACPNFFTKSLVDFLSHLIVVDKTQRYGLLKDGTNDIKHHLWYKGYDWDGTLYKRIKPLFIPRTNSRNDTSNFAKIKDEKLRTAVKNEYSKEFYDLNF